ncbi:MAG: hypothetical protein WEB50_08585 [Vicinamibacterales bacterium]
MRSIRQFVSVWGLNKVLLEPRDGLRDLLTWGAGRDEAPELRTVRTCQQAENDFLLDQRRQAGIGGVKRQDLVDIVAIKRILKRSVKLFLVTPSFGSPSC